MIIETLQQSLSEKSGYVFLSPVARQYVTGVRTSYGMVLITKKDACFYTDFRYLELAERHARDGIMVFKLEKSIHDQMAACAKAFDLDELILEEDHVTMQTAKVFADLPVTYAASPLLSMRMRKTEAEIAAMRKAQAITDKAYEQILGDIHIGMSEKDVMAKLIYRLYANGADGLSFDPIVVSGANGALPHGVATENPLESGTFLTMDFGVIKDGYCSDMTRTVAIGKPSEKMEFVYNTVLEAQQKALAAIHAGVIGKEVDRAARDHINAAGFEGRFDHGTGHSIGIEIHEAPNFSLREERPIPAGAVLSVEPGIYLSGEMGVRIEDMVLVTENGYENFTKSPKELIILK